MTKNLIQYSWFPFTVSAALKSSFQEKLCYIALDFDSEMKAASESSDKDVGSWGLHRHLFGIPGVMVA